MACAATAIAPPRAKTCGGGTLAAAAADYGLVSDPCCCCCCCCRFVHGEEGLAQALKATEALRPGAATALDAATLEAIAGTCVSVIQRQVLVWSFKCFEMLDYMCVR
jgi:hypothetical protein